MKRPKAIPTRERILDEVEWLIAKKGVYGFKLRDVAEALGLKVPAIYKHYASRDDVLVEVSRRFVTLLAAQFAPVAGDSPAVALRTGLNSFVEFLILHPAYVRLALVDYATPEGGMEYVKQAAGGSFQANFIEGPLAALYARLRTLLRAGARSGELRKVDETDFYRVLTSTLLVRLVFPDDGLLLRRVSRADISRVQRWLLVVMTSYLSPRKNLATRKNPACRKNLSRSP